MTPDTDRPGAANGGPAEDDLLDFSEMSDAEKTSLVDSLLDEMRELFHGYIAGATPFEEVAFETFDTLQTLHAIATGSLMVEYFDEDDDDGEYAEFDELAGEPTGDGRAQPAGEQPGGKGQGKRGGGGGGRRGGHERR